MTCCKTWGFILKIYSFEIKHNWCICPIIPTLLIGSRRLYFFLIRWCFECPLQSVANSWILQNSYFSRFWVPISFSYIESWTNCNVTDLFDLQNCKCPSFEDNNKNRLGIFLLLVRFTFKVENFSRKSIQEKMLWEMWGPYCTSPLWEMWVRILCKCPSSCWLAFSLIGVYMAQ